MSVSNGQPLGIGTRNTYLPQFVILNQLRSVPVDEGIEGQTILPAIREGKGYELDSCYPGSPAHPYEPTAMTNSHKQKAQCAAGTAATQYARIENNLRSQTQSGVKYDKMMIWHWQCDFEQITELLPQFSSL